MGATQNSTASRSCAARGGQRRWLVGWHCEAATAPRTCCPRTFATDATQAAAGGPAALQHAAGLWPERSARRCRRPAAPTVGGAAPGSARRPSRCACGAPPCGAGPSTARSSRFAGRARGCRPPPSGGWEPCPCCLQHGQNVEGGQRRRVGCCQRVGGLAASSSAARAWEWAR